MPISDSTATQHVHRSNSRHHLRAKLRRGMQTRGTATRESLQMRPQYGPIFYAISTVIWLNLAETPPITKLPPGRKRPTLRYDYKRPTSPSRAIASATPFSRLRYDREQYRTPEEYLEAQLKVEWKRGSESEDARREREARVHCEKFAGGPITNAPDNTLPTKDESWMIALSANERQAYRLRDQGFNQEEIGKRMGKAQETVSRWLKSIEGKRRAAQVQKFRETGGA
jgi:predicted DNA-binding protein (UPF0251 family)